MTFDCAAAEEHMDAWALGALDADDARAFDAHLVSCLRCQALADAAVEAAHNVALAVPLRAAPASLKARVIASAAVLREVRQRNSRYWPVAAAALLVLASGAMAWGAYMQVRVADLGDQNASISANATAQSEQLATVRVQISQAGTKADTLADTVDAQDDLIEIVAGADVRRTPMAGTAMAPGASGYYVWSPAERAGAFVGANMPALAPGKAYCLWFVYEGGWVNAGYFEVDDDGGGRLLVEGIDGGGLGELRGYVVSVEDATTDAARSSATVLVSAE